MYERLIKKCRHVSCTEYSRESRDVLAEVADAIEELDMKLHGANAAIAGMQREIDRMVVYGNNPRWIPVTERLPICGDTVICFGDGGIEIADFVMGDKWSALPWFFTDGEQETGITHWMPIPKAPEESE